MNDKKRGRVEEQKSRREEEENPFARNMRACSALLCPFFPLSWHKLQVRLAFIKNGDCLKRR
jgi:hypothetical protein